MTKLHNFIEPLVVFLIATLSLVGASGPAHALGTPSSGQIGTILVVGSADGAPGVEDFRVHLAGTPIICNGNTWAYINTTDVNY
jgi:hypothetical protein